MNEPSFLFKWKAQDANDWKVGYVYFRTLIIRFVCLSLSEYHVLIYRTGAWMLVSNSVAGNSLTDRNV